MGGWGKPVTDGGGSAILPGWGKFEFKDGDAGDFVRACSADCLLSTSWVGWGDANAGGLFRSGDVVR